jgi:hypothetical protein
MPYTTKEQIASKEGLTTWVFLIKLLHSLIFVFMSTCVGYLFYASFTATYDWKLAFVIGVILLEGVILLLSGRRCPLSTLARKLGDETGDDLIADYLLPKWAVRKTVPFCTLIFVSGLVLVAVTYLLRL